MIVDPLLALAAAVEHVRSPDGPAEIEMDWDTDLPDGGHLHLTLAVRRNPRPPARLVAFPTEEDPS